MDCRDIAFSAEKSHQRIANFSRVFKPELLQRILAFALYLLGAPRQMAASMAGMPENSLKTVLRTVQRDGFAALRDRRFAGDKVILPPGSPPVETRVMLQADEQFCVVRFDGEHEITIRRNHTVHLKTFLLSLYQSGLLSASEVASALGVTTAHCQELARQLARQDVVDTLVDKRQGQKQDYLVATEEKAEIIKHFAALAVTGRSTSSDALAKAIHQTTGISLSPRTIRWHMNKLGLNRIKKTLPALVETLKKNCGTF